MVSWIYKNVLLKGNQLIVLVGQGVARMSGIVGVEGILEQDAVAVEHGPRHGFGAELTGSIRVGEHETVLHVAVGSEEGLQRVPVLRFLQHIRPDELDVVLFVDTRLEIG